MYTNPLKEASPAAPLANPITLPLTNFADESSKGTGELLPPVRRPNRRFFKGASKGFAERTTIDGSNPLKEASPAAPLADPITLPLTNFTDESSKGTGELLPPVRRPNRRFFKGASKGFAERTTIDGSSNGRDGHLCARQQVSAPGNSVPFSGEPSRERATQQKRLCDRCGSDLHSTSECRVCLRCQNSQYAKSRRYSCKVVYIRTMAMRTLKDQGDASRIEPIFDGLMSQGHRPSLESFSYSLSGLCAQQQCLKAEKRLWQMEKEGLQPDAFCFNTVINGFCAEGNMDAAIRIFEAMKLKGCKPTTSTFNILIKGYGLVRKPREAMRLLNEMEAENSTPNVRTFNVLLNAWCRSKDLEEACNVMTMMRDAGVAPDVVSYNTMATAFAEQGMMSRAECVIREMQASCLRPDEYACGIVINGLCKRGEMDRALELLERMNLHGLTPTLAIFNTLIKGYANALQQDRVDQVLKLMETFDLKPNVQTFGLMMNGWSSAGLGDEAKAVLQRMRAAFIQPDAIAYGILAKGFVRSKKPHEAEALLKDMASNGVSPNAILYTTVISGWCNVGRMDDALRTYNEMLKCRVVPSMRTFQTLIWGFSEAKVPHRAEEVIQLMKEQHIPLDRKVLEMIADAWRGIGLPGEASRLSVTYKEVFTQCQPPRTSDARKRDDTYVDNCAAVDAGNTAASVDSEFSRELTDSFHVPAIKESSIELKASSNQIRTNKEVWKRPFRANNRKVIRTDCAQTVPIAPINLCDSYSKIAEKSFTRGSSLSGLGLMCLPFSYGFN